MGTYRPIKNDAWDALWPENPAAPGLTVFEPETHPIPTGILDQNGVPIYRVEQRHPVGFCVTPRRMR
jgi:hypothetical protein